MKRARAYERRVPMWLRAVRSIGTYGGALALGVASFVMAMVATAALSEDAEWSPGVEDVATDLQTEPVAVEDTADGLLTPHELAQIGERARAAKEPTRVVVWAGEGWPSDLAEEIVVASDLDTRIIVVDDEGHVGGASTLDEAFAFSADVDPQQQSLAEGTLAALDKADEIPLLGEPETYDVGESSGVETWGAAALGAAIVVLTGGVVVGLLAIGASVVILLLIAAYGAYIGWRRKVAGIPITQDPSRRRRHQAMAYRPPTEVLVRLGRTHASERDARLRAEVLALGERVDAATAPAHGDAWQHVFDGYEAAGRIADRTEGRDDLAARADVVAGLVLVGRARQALDAAERGATYAPVTGCYANPFHGRAAGEVNTVRLGSRRLPAGVPDRVSVCATCLASAENGVAVADPLTLDDGSGRLEAYWLLGVTPWTQTGYGAPTLPDL